MRNILRLRVLGMIMMAVGLFGGSVVTVNAQGTDATPPGESCIGSLGVSAFLSDQVSVPTITFATASADADDEGADFVNASFALFINGDLTAAPFATFNTYNGDAVVIDGIPSGEHVLVYYAPDGTEWSWWVTIEGCVDEFDDGGFTVVTVLIPQGETPGVSDTGSLVLSCYAADQVESPEFYVSDPINVPPAGPEEFPASSHGSFDIPYAGAYVVDREFLVYLNQDFSSVPIGLQCIGGTALLDNLPSGTHSIVDVQTGWSDQFSILSGYITTVVAIFPEGFGDTGDVDDTDTEAPDADDDNGYGDDDDNGYHDHDGKGYHDHKDKDYKDHSHDKDYSGGSGDDTTYVTSLPATGQGGIATGSNTIVLVLGALSFVALAGAFAWRQRRMA